jgi:hypothetical protein
MAPGWALALGLVLLWSEAAEAQSMIGTSSVSAPGAAPRFDPAPDPEVRDPRLEPPPARSPFRNPRGAVVTNGILGVATGSGGTSLVVGAGVGYSVVTGVVPGVRGLLVVGQGVGGELALTATLTPPVEWDVTPFVVVEGGRRWLDGATGWLYGAGGGVYIGSPLSRFGFQLGWVWRRFAVSGGPTYDVSTPIGGVSVRF